MYQLILDVSRTDVQDYLIERMCTILDSAPISYIKWDMNRSICDKFSHQLDAAHQGQFSHRYVLGLVPGSGSPLPAVPRSADRGVQRGGGRFDAGMLYYCPQIWCSDNSDASAGWISSTAPLRLPGCTMGAHVSAVPNHQTGRVTPLATRAAVAMAGTFGYELDLATLSDAEKEAIRRQIDTFQAWSDLLQQGDYYRLRAPGTGCAVWENVDASGTEALVTAVYSHVVCNGGLIRVKVQGLRPEGQYRVHLLKEDETADWSRFEFATDRFLSGAAPGTRRRG